VLLSAANLKRLVEAEVDPSTVLPEGEQLKAGLVIASIDPNYKKIIEHLIKWVPRLLALIPYLIFIVAYVKENSWENPFNIIIVMLIGIAHFLIIVFRRPVIKKVMSSKKAGKNNSVAAEEKRAYSWEGEKNVWNAVRTSSVFSNTIITVIMAICVFIYAIAAAFSSPTDPGRPGLIILSSLIVYTLLGLVINLYVNRYRVPVFIILVLFAVFIASPRNENHSVQMLNNPADTKMIIDRKVDSVYCSEWIDNKMKKGIYDTSKQSTIFLIAAEGGGIRSCYWTYLVLQKLQNLQPSFYDHTFAATGASGGSMGLGFYYSYIYHNKNKLNSSKFLLSGDDSAQLDAICSGDYLSRVTYGFLYPDLIQRFIPWPIESWDRAKYMANSFDDGFSGKFIPRRGNLLSRNYQEMWSGTDAYDHPALLFNSTYAERGSKAIFSP
jgi:F0F1-type ATP synthase assembly protein I